ncbi:MAG: hypothetical protein IPJ65_03730 [Archangiaceae bacterium]|nr:hypothetical protein [Archangiaceae bacterium]
MLLLSACAPSLDLRGKACESDGSCPEPLICSRGACVDNPCPGTDGRPGAALVPACGAWLGLYPSLVPSWSSALTTLESSAGAPVDLAHAYHDWFSEFPTDDEEGISARGTWLYFDWQPRRGDGTPVPWADIADGAHDTAIDARAVGLAALKSPVFISFGATAQNSVGAQGTAADFVRAFRHVRERVMAKRPTGTAWVWAPSGTRPIDSSTRTTLYPGDDAVDWVGFTAYHNYRCVMTTGAWVAPDALFGDTYDAATALGKPVVLYELGCVEDASDPQRKAQWYLELGRLAPTRFSQLRAVMFQSSGATEPACSFHVDSSSAALSAFQSLQGSAYFRPPRP